jgi:hypothetical protein
MLATCCAGLHLSGLPLKQHRNPVLLLGLPNLGLEPPPRIQAARIYRVPASCPCCRHACWVKDNTPTYRKTPLRPCIFFDKHNQGYRRATATVHTGPETCDLS